MEKRKIFENTRLYNCEDIKNASIENLKLRALKLYIILTILLILVGGLFVGLGIAYNGDITTLVSGIVILFMVCFMWTFYLIAITKIKKADYKDTEYKYTFYEDELIINVNSINLNQHMVIKYNDVIKCVKSKNYTFIFINRIQAFFFLNADLNDEVYNLLKKNIKNYKD